MNTKHASKIIVAAVKSVVTMSFVDATGKEFQKLSMTPALALEVADLLYMQSEVAGSHMDVIDLITNPTS